MPHLVRWQEELGNFGLVIIGPHAQGGSADAIKAKAQSLGVNFTIITGGGVKGGTDFNGIPHAMLFDHTGKCLYRGSPDAAEKGMRIALGKALVANMERTASSKSVLAQCESLKKGQSPAGVLPKLIPLLKAADKNTAEEAKLLVASLTASAQKRLDDAKPLLTDDPYTAYNLIEKVPTTFKGTPVATQANDMLTTLRKDKKVQAEMKARPSLDAVKKLDSSLSASAAKLDPKAPAFLKQNAPTISKMKGTLQLMKKSWPDAKATQEAMVIGEKYGVVLR